MNIGSVLLAAGASRRFGKDNKLLAEIGGKPLVRWVAEVITHSGARDIVAVTGCDRPFIENALEGLPLRFAHNPSWTAGVGSSIAVGITALGSQPLGAFIVPGDMPFLTSALLKDLMATFVQAGGASIVYPTTLSGEQRNPVLWPQSFFPMLASLSGPHGAKRLLATFLSSQKQVPVVDESAFADIDLPADLEAGRSQWIGLNP
ncbi:MAG TPA: nucleotidyltransferase family protein [Methyloceanibacter sp.]|nr:nucleotidyltransferase family protein [Methyloceanibacter sp.]